MIVKELDELSSEDKFAKAGRSTEAQMAYYLRRAFGEDKNVFVFNNLRIEKEPDSAQIHHLILHQYGIFIVESKSVTTSIEINENGEWIRWFSGKPKGMPSPILQAQRQGEFLRKYLNDRAEILLDKILGLRQATFRNMPLDIIVAISDSGIIKRPNKVLLNEVCKADQVTEKIWAKIEKSHKDNSWFNLDLTVSNYSFTQDELTRITKFLLSHHKPLICKQPEQTNFSFQSHIDKPKPANIKVQQVETIVCRHCHSSSLSVEYGKYGYYFKCMECNGNTSINSMCTACGGKEKIRKSGRQFYAECESCNTSNLFHTNPAVKSK